jgi:hypothetical protein
VKRQTATFGQTLNLQVCLDGKKYGPGISDVSSASRAPLAVYRHHEAGEMTDYDGGDEDGGDEDGGDDDEGRMECDGQLQLHTVVESIIQRSSFTDFSLPRVVRYPGKRCVHNLVC